MSNCIIKLILVISLAPVWILSEAQAQSYVEEGWERYRNARYSVSAEEMIELYDRAIELLRRDIRLMPMARSYPRGHYDPTSSRISPDWYLKGNVLHFLTGTWPQEWVSINLGVNYGYDPQKIIERVNQIKQNFLNRLEALNGGASCNVTISR